MFKDFHFLSEAKQKEIIVTNPNMIADQCEMIKAIKDELFTPADDFLKDKGIPSIKDRLSEMCYERHSAVIHGNWHPCGVHLTQ